MRHPDRGGIIFRLIGLVCLLALVWALYVLRHPVLRLAGHWMAKGDSPIRADAIMVLGDDNFGGDRASEAAELFRAGWAPEVVASGRKIRPYASVAEFIERDLESRGVPSQAVLRFDHGAQNTREEAELLRNLAADHHWTRLLVVTSNYHSRRARYIFRKVFPTPISLMVVPARDINFDPDSWWQTREGRKLFFLEAVGYLLARWELRGTESGAPTATVRYNPSVRSIMAIKHATSAFLGT